ncbi:hypothetical protein [Leucobacter luti]|uniref:Ig-like domain-containing protein n=1 Tax=Leucobacter luti TaxID=340320 RepID=A0A4Q7U5J1_9MICO|nr:hypothetical protein [Leucobacter luti]MBL3700908.1 hypothetical protein [Leucobacter luti]RZT68874.1 hypothetical protein EV139_0605 [Leucobacter luti]
MIRNRTSGPARRATSLIAGVTTAALALLIAPSPAFAMPADALENASTITAASTPGFAPTPRSVPAVESTLGRGDALSTDPATRVAVAGLGSEQRAALVRVTVTQPDAAVTVFTGAADTAGTPVLAAAAGTTASATTLLPASAGNVSLWADQAVPVRVELLAAFSGSVDAPGSTIALESPATRADTGAGLGGSALTADPLWFGLTGEGGVPATQVRSVYVSLDVTLDAAAELEFGPEQRFPLPAGRSVVTTVVEPDARGGVLASLAGGASGALRADVLGWVPEAPSDLSRSNSTGSYVASTEVGEATAQLRAGAKATRLQLSDQEDIGYELALVSAQPSTRTTPAAETSTLEWAATPRGRAQGIAVDATAGAAPQLALVPVRSEHAQLTIRRGAADVRVFPLGGFLSEPVAQPTEEQPTVQITAPRDLDSVNISETGAFTLEGTVTAGSNSIDRIEISSPSAPGDGFIGTAELNYGSDEVTWSFTAAAPEDGDFDYIASVFDRGEPQRAAAEDRVTLTVSTADEDDTVVTHEAQVLNTDPARPDFVQLDEHRISFTTPPALEPGDIVLSDATPGTPEGFLGRVTAINLVDGAWLVDTSTVSLAELIYQADVDGTFEFTDGVGVEVEDLPAASGDGAELMTASYAVADEDGNFGPDIPADSFESAPGVGGTNAELFTGDDVDLELDPADYDVDPSQFELECRLPGADGQEPTGEEIGDDGEWLSPVAGTPVPSPADCAEAQQLRAELHRSWSFGVDANLLIAYENGKFNFRNQTGDDEEQQEQAKRSKLATKAAIAIQASGQVSVSLDIVLDVSFKFKWKVIPTGVNVNDFTVQFTTDLKAQAAAQIYFEMKYRFNFRQQIAAVGLPTVSFFVGPVPIVITNALKISVGVSAEMKAQAEVPLIGVSRTDQFGFRYSSELGLRRIKNDPKTVYPSPIFTPLGEATTLSLAGLVAVGPEVTYDSKIYGFAGPELTLFARAGVQGEAAAHPSDLRQIEAKVAVFADLGLIGEAKLKLIRWKILEFTVFNLNWRLTLFSKEWEFRI